MIVGNLKKDWYEISCTTVYANKIKTIPFQNRLGKLNVLNITCLVFSALKRRLNPVNKTHPQQKCKSVNKKIE
jgi:hypothetical protein